MNKQVNFNILSIIIEEVGVKGKSYIRKEDFIRAVVESLDYKEITARRAIDSFYKDDITYPYECGGRVVVLRPSFYKEYYTSITPERIYKYKLQLAKAELKRNIGE
ncbi:MULTISPECIES: hypothetical protein [Klebsiella]|uniref:hypothetical protein n=1 Tax=Klebsiella TaxID=570 RepID=UPI00051607DD|nr:MULTISPECIES: hypothetical protein [Klebsiella]AUV97265.1 hypothetical protein C2U46_06065 [Klebsiella oxytoca]MBG2573059.1 hypothetical protein [Klebsiella sp. LTGPAF-6F]MBZ6668310.1 hypothetical protein [Klebsiella michiganensis]MBZ7429151.1 hypothetical protein [Klebsiella michiganensis]MBZ7477396.1 hypothetical protein [Klebsiella michiganensis]